MSRSTRGWAWMLALAPLVAFAQPASAATGEVVQGTIVHVAAEDGAEHAGIDTFLDLGGFDLKAVDDARLTELDPGVDVTVRVADADAATLQVLSVQRVETADGSSGAVANATAPHTVRVAMAIPTGVTQDATPFTETQVRAAIAEASQYWSDQTGRQVSFTVANVVPWYTSSATCANYNALWSDAAARTGFTSAPREHLVVVVPQRALTTGACNAYGKGVIGDSVNAYGALYVTDLEPSLIAHELGHNVSLGHANALYNTTLSDVAYANGYANSEVVSYGDVYDVMSYSGSTIGHGNIGIAGQARLGVQPGGIRTVTTSGDYPITALPVASDGGTYGLTVRDGATDYYVELRGTSPGDDLVASDWRSPVKGVRVTKKDDSETHASVVLDGTPTGRSGSDFDFAVPQGATLTSASGRLRFTTVAVDGQRATVHVDIVGSPAPTTVPGAPTITSVTATTSRSATVSWSAGSTGGGTVVDQTVTPYVNGVPDSTKAIVVGPSTTSATFSTLTDGTAYTFAVTARNEIGAGPTSVPSTAVLVAGAPGTPTAPAVTLSGSTATVSWTAPAANGTAITGYVVTPLKDAVPQTPRTVSSPSASVALSSTGTYSFTVAAVNARGTSAASPVSNGVTYAVPTTSPAPVIPVTPPVTTTPVTTPPVTTAPVVVPPVTTAPVTSPPVTTAPAPTPVATTVVNVDGSTTYTGPTGVTGTVGGAIQSAYLAQGGPSSRLGLPTSPERTINGGRFNTFENGSIYWSASTGAHPVSGSVLQAWGRIGWENSPLGFPSSDVIATRQGGSVQRFQGGLVYSSTAGTHVVRGAIESRFAGQGWENGGLGYPSTSETALRGGAYNHFQNGSVYWTPAGGAQVVKGSIRDRWSALGWENSMLGYPVSEEVSARGGGVVQRFESGLVYWTPTLGAHEVHGAFLGAYQSRSWERGALGYPRTGEYTVPGGVRQDFDGGSLVYDATTGRVTVR